MNKPVDEAIRELKASTSKFAAELSFSQLGEDRVLSWVFGHRRNGFYVDIGCHHPYHFSNTALLHVANGWSGINVDVDERSIAAFKEIRPEDKNICAAVGGEAGQLDVTLFQNGELNTLDPTMAMNPAWADLVIGTRTVDVLPLRDILNNHVPAGQKIDFLNIDIEGLDYAALISNDWEVFVPEIIAVEVHNFDIANASNNPTFKLLVSKGYRLLAHCVVTSIYQRHVT